MAGLTPLFDSGSLDRFYERFTDQAKDKFIQVLTYAGEEGVKYARENGKYNDVTGNLRSSIGYAVIKSGSVVSESYQPAKSGTDKEGGIEAAKRLVREVISEHRIGYGLVLVAGMDYAVKVEAMDNKDVLSGAVIHTERELREIIEKVLE